MKASWNNRIIAESNDTRIVENNHYFPSESVHREYLKKSKDTYTCPWKGLAEYYDVTVDGETVTNGAFSYPDPTPAAKEIQGRFAFWNGVDVAP
ncbi:MAG: hypothetical protein B7X04_01605 [Parcubacteria group bacterium 21-54-25]|nr:MAG: hypothetical protein B7X04_01605 [Parcubacteria group bacterium 21-54-25]HQU07620.1 DUF427 domain-containing protein [Candidatus Paceibacterota bacterium]